MERLEVYADEVSVAQGKLAEHFLAILLFGLDLEVLGVLFAELVGLSLGESVRKDDHVLDGFSLLKRDTQLPDLALDDSEPLLVLTQLFSGDHVDADEPRVLDEEVRFLEDLRPQFVVLQACLLRLLSCEPDFFGNDFESRAGNPVGRDSRFVGGRDDGHDVIQGDVFVDLLERCQVQVVGENAERLGPVPLSKELEELKEHLCGLRHVLILLADARHHDCERDAPQVAEDVAVNVLAHGPELDQLQSLPEYLLVGDCVYD